MVSEDGQAKGSIRSLLFFTLGGTRSEEVAAFLDQECRRYFPSYQGAGVVYFEGRFGVPSAQTPLKIKLIGTDLLRGHDALLAPKFINSQYENLTYPLERCTIYDAISHAFHCAECLDDVRHYWRSVLEMAVNRVTFESYLSDRMPNLEVRSSLPCDLVDIAKQQLQKIEALG